MEYINAKFPSLKELERSHIQQCEVILDCTAQDEVLHALEQFPWNDTKRFISIAMGLHARRLFCFTAYGTRFFHEAFSDALNLQLQKELKQYVHEELPREGIGCWHPVFPARGDDVWMMAAIAVKYIESVLTTHPIEPTLSIFEQYFENGVFAGIRSVAAGAIHA